MKITSKRHMPTQVSITSPWIGIYYNGNLVHSVTRRRRGISSYYVSDRYSGTWRTIKEWEQKTLEWVKAGFPAMAT